MMRVRGLLRLAAIGLFAVGCTAKDEGGGSDGDGTEVPPYEEKSFNPTLVMVDEANFALANMAVDFDGKRSMTDAKGQVVLPDLDVEKALAVSISGEGYVPTFVNVTFGNSFPSRTVVLHRTLQAVVDAKTGGTVSVGKSSVRLPGRGLIKSSGEPHDGEVVVTFAASNPEKDGEWARDPKDEAPKGWTGPSQTKSAGIHAELTDKSGKPLTFAQGESAEVKLAVPKDADAKEGTQYELKSLNPMTGERSTESSCTVVKEGDDLVCVGRVEHFSTWLVSWNVRGSGRNDLGCAQYKVTLTEAPAGMAKLQTFIGALGTDGKWLNGRAGPNVCVVGAMGQKPRILGHWSSSDYRTFEVELEALPAGSLTTDRVYREAPDCGPDGALKCAQYVVNINPNDYAQDSDMDGAADKADCDPDDPSVYPRAPRNYCDTVDHDCDGKPDGDKLDELREKSPLEWNALCPWIKASCKSELGDEVDGNEADEDCDGFVSDHDGDGFYAYADPKRGDADADCDDFDANANPMGTEAPNNRIDEDCDGVYSDADGDGVKSAKELVALAGAGNLDVSMVDCNDFDADVKPGAMTTDAQLFAKGGSFYDDAGKRTAAFCRLFDAAGKLTRYGWSVMRASDRNCNGVLEDLDGDGDLVAAGGPFANEGPYDLNDLDPGVTSAGGKEADGEACEYKADLTNFGGGANRVCPLLFGLEQACVEAKDQDMQGTGIYVCAAFDYTGFKIAPNPLQPSKQYGPCSEETACTGEAFLQCGGPVTFSEDYITELASAPDGIDLSGVAFQGLCMPRCDPL